MLVAEGDRVHAGDALLTIDDSVQRATAEQQQAQAEAARAMLAELKAEPRPETLDVAAAQVDNATATLKNAQDQLAKQERAYALDPKSISRDALDNARNAERIAATNLKVVQRQYALTKAGAWVFDVQNQEKQFEALSKAYAASAALLGKYTIRAPADGMVLLRSGHRRQLRLAAGRLRSATPRGMNPLIVMGTADDHLQVRAYIDEILVHRLADPSRMDAQMFIRGTEIHLPLTFSAYPALRVAEDRALRSAAGAGRCARAARDFPFRQTERPEPLPGATGRCLCRREITAGSAALSRLLAQAVWRLRGRTGLRHRPAAPAVTHYAHGADPTATASAGGTAQHFSAGRRRRRRLVAAVPLAAARRR